MVIRPISRWKSPSPWARNGRKASPSSGPCSFWFWRQFFIESSGGFNQSSRGVIHMEFRQLRNATIMIGYAGKRFLVDPMLAEKGGFPGFEGTINSHIPNPLVDLPAPMDEILDVDAVIVTHTHPDHWDEAAINLVPKDMLIFAQNEKDAAEIRGQGFRNVRALEEKTV